MAAVVVLALLVAGVLLVNARASMLGAQASAAAAEIKTLEPVVSAYGLEHSGYTEMTPAALKQDYNLQLGGSAAGTLEITGASTSGFCIQIRDGAWYAAQQGPGGAIETSRNKICR